jgi:hypothetical protein
VDLAGKDSNKAGALKELIWNVMKETANPNLADFFPVLKKVDPQGIRRRMAGHARMILGLFDGMINQRLQLRKLSGSITDSEFLDILLSINEEKSEEMDKTTILHLLRVSTITLSLFLILENSFIISLFFLFFFFSNFFFCYFYE